MESYTHVLMTQLFKSLLLVAPAAILVACGPPPEPASKVHSAMGVLVGEVTTSKALFRCASLGQIS